jgi:hypothetical protein
VSRGLFNRPFRFSRHGTFAMKFRGSINSNGPLPDNGQSGSWVLIGANRQVWLYGVRSSALWGTNSDLWCKSPGIAGSNRVSGKRTAVPGAGVVGEKSMEGSCAATSIANTQKSATTKQQRLQTFPVRGTAVMDIDACTIHSQTIKQQH